MRHQSGCLKSYGTLWYIYFWGLIFDMVEEAGHFLTRYEGPLLEYDASPSGPLQILVTITICWNSPSGHASHFWEVCCINSQKKAYFCKAPNLMKFYFCLSIPNPWLPWGRQKMQDSKNIIDPVIFSKPHPGLKSWKDYRCPYFTVIIVLHNSACFLKGTVHSKMKYIIYDHVIDLYGFLLQTDKKGKNTFWTRYVNLNCYLKCFNSHNERERKKDFQFKSAIKKVLKKCNPLNYQITIF